MKVVCWPCGVFLILSLRFLIAALLSDSSLTPEQRIQVFQQSGVYP